MTTLQQAQQATLNLIAEIGVSATSDPRDLTVPGVLLMPEQLSYDSLDRTALTVKWQCWLVSQDADPILILSKFADMFNALELASEFTAISVNLPNHSPDPLPALQCHIEMRYTDD